MTESPDATTRPTLAVEDKVLAKLAAFEAAQTPGVARLHPYVIQAARNAVNSAAKRAAARLTGTEAPTDTASASGAAAVTSAADAADPSAVDVDHDTETGALTLTIRIVASTRPPILGVVRELQQRINSRITEAAGITPLVIVNVLDIDPPPPL